MWQAPVSATLPLPPLLQGQGEDRAPLSVELLTSAPFPLTEKEDSILLVTRLGLPEDPQEVKMLKNLGGGVWASVPADVDNILDKAETPAGSSHMV